MLLRRWRQLTAWRAFIHVYERVLTRKLILVLTNELRGIDSNRNRFNKRTVNVTEIVWSAWKCQMLVIDYRFAPKYCMFSSNRSVYIKAAQMLCSSVVKAKIASCDCTCTCTRTCTCICVDLIVHGMHEKAEYHCILFWQSLGQNVAVHNLLRHL